MRNYGLDVIRAISIWMVLIMHMGVNPVWLRPYGLGGYGVEVFFVLSGFLIGGLLFRSLKKENSVRSIARFWVRRWFRILPLYYLCLSLKYFIVGPSIGKNILYYVFFLQNHLYGVQFYSVTWSLVIEEWFYIIIPLFIAGALYFTRGKTKKMLGSMILLIVCVLILRSLYVIETNTGFYGVYGNVPLRFDSLFIGVILAYVKSEMTPFYEKLRNLRSLSIALTLIAAVVIVNGLANMYDLVLFQRFSQTVGFSFLSVLIALIIPFTESITIPRQNLWSARLYRALTWTSLLTYGLYLFHPLVFELFGPFVSGHFPYWMNDILLIATTYLVAWLAYIGFERPILLIRDRLTQGRMNKGKYEA